MAERPGEDREFLAVLQHERGVRVPKVAEPLAGVRARSCGLESMCDRAVVADVRSRFSPEPASRAAATGYPSWEQSEGPPESDAVTPPGERIWAPPRLAPQEY